MLEFKEPKNNHLRKTLLKMDIVYISTVVLMMGTFITGAFIICV